MSPGRVDSERSQNSIDEFAQPPSVTSLFNDASGYKEAIAESFQNRLSTELRSVNPALRSVQDFAELAGDDLEPPEHDVVGRFAQFAAEEWAVQEGDDLLTDEPGVMGDEEHVEDLQDEVEETHISKPTVPPLQTDIEGEDKIPLSSEEVLALLIEEFGPLAPPGEEKLLLQADGGVIQDVVILVRVSFLAQWASLSCCTGSYPPYQSSHHIPCIHACLRS